MATDGPGNFVGIVNDCRDLGCCTVHMHILGLTVEQSDRIVSSSIIRLMLVVSRYTYAAGERAF